MTRRKGHLVIVGGAEDRKDDKLILSTVCGLSGGSKARIVVLTTASRLANDDPAVALEYQELYEGAFRECGAGEVVTLHIHDRHAANDPRNVEIVSRATGVFMTGGAQERLVNILGGTEVLKAMREVYCGRGGCIAGTSAGASAMSEHMLAGGPSEIRPTKGMVPLAAGLGFLQHVVIDQHFSERQRLSRLLSLVAQNPFLVGIGIDEDTALVVGPHAEIEIVGNGAVTILDGREILYTGCNEVSEGDVFSILDVKLHLLPAGFRFNMGREGEVNAHPGHPVPMAFRELIETVAFPD